MHLNHVVCSLPFQSHQGRPSRNLDTGKPGGPLWTGHRLTLYQARQPNRSSSMISSRYYLYTSQVEK